MAGSTVFEIIKANNFKIEMRKWNGLIGVDHKSIWLLCLDSGPRGLGSSRCLACEQAL